MKNLDINSHQNFKVLYLGFRKPYKVCSLDNKTYFKTTMNFYYIFVYTVGHSTSCLYINKNVKKTTCLCFNLDFKSELLK